MRLARLGVLLLVATACVGPPKWRTPNQHTPEEAQLALTITDPALLDRDILIHEVVRIPMPKTLRPCCILGDQAKLRVGPVPVPQVRAAMFRSVARRTPFDLESGAEVLVFADVSIYAARGDLQLIVREVEPRGMGALQLAFEQLRRRLHAEGLFDSDRKRELPAFPRRIGVVTSPHGP